MKKILTLCLAALLAATAVVGGTLAYFTDTDDAVNTFTVGKVKLTLDETDVKPDGTKDTDARVHENDYHLIPGHHYVKDPTVTVKAGSEPSYVRVFVKLNKLAVLKSLFGASFLPQDYVDGSWDSDFWPCTGVRENGDTVTYEFRYRDIVSAMDNLDKPLLPLFTSITVPGTLTGEQLAELGGKTSDNGVDDSFRICITAQAIQADGFADAEAAWTAFDAA